MRAIIQVSVLLLAAVAGPAEAAVDLYVGEATVADQGGAERSRALPLALEQVFRKLTGLRGFDDYPLVGLALDKASDTVLSYHYRKVIGVLPDGGEAEELRLVARFAEAAVDDLLRTSQLPRWPPERRNCRSSSCPGSPTWWALAAWPDSCSAVRETTRKASMEKWGSV